MNDEVKAELGRYEIVEWRYDGLNGKIIPWTLENGGTSHDPSVQAFVLHADGTVIARAPDAQVYQPGRFAKWAREQADAFERRFPPTRVPLVRTEVEQTDEVLRCPAVDEAREAGRPVLLYFGRAQREGLARAERAQVKAARKFERGTLDSKKAAEAAAGWALYRLDLGDEAGAAYAALLGVKSAPALVLFAPGADDALVLPARLTGASLAYHLKKHAPE